MVRRMRAYSDAHNGYRAASDLRMERQRPDVCFRAKFAGRHLGWSSRALRITALDDAGYGTAPSTGRVTRGRLRERLCFACMSTWRTRKPVRMKSRIYASTRTMRHLKRPVGSKQKLQPRRQVAKSLKLLQTRNVLHSQHQPSSVRKSSARKTILTSHPFRLIHPIGDKR